MEWEGSLVVTGHSRFAASWAAFLALVGANAAALAYTSRWGGNFGESEATLVDAVSVLQVALPFIGFFWFRRLYKLADASVAVRHARMILVLGGVVFISLLFTVLMGIGGGRAPTTAWVLAWNAFSSLAFLPFVGAWVISHNDAWQRWVSVACAVLLIVVSVSSVTFALRAPFATAAELSPSWAMLLIVLVLAFYCASLVRLSLLVWLLALISLCALALLMSKQIFFVGVFYGGMGPLLLFALFALVIAAVQYLGASRAR
jgi:hypothetical protein